MRRRPVLVVLKPAAQKGLAEEPGAAGYQEDLRRSVFAWIGGHIVLSGSNEVAELGVSVTGSFGCYPAPGPVDNAWQVAHALRHS